MKRMETKRQWMARRRNFAKFRLEGALSAICDLQTEAVLTDSEHVRLIELGNILMDMMKYWDIRTREGKYDRS